MSYSINIVFMILIALQLQSIECNPIDNKKDLIRVQRNIQFLGANSKEWSDYHRSWNFPHFPSISFFFKDNDNNDDDEDISDTNGRLDELEKTQKEILILLKKLSDDLLAIKDQVNEDEETSSIVNEIKTTSFPSSEITITTERLEIESLPLTTSNTFEKTTTRETIETDFPSAISNTFVTSPPASEMTTLVASHHKEIPSILLETESQTTEKNENTSVNHDRVHFNDEQEKRWNTPPELTPEQVTRKKPETINGRAEARFLPFSASFSLNAGQDNSEALQLGAGLGGISVSQSSSFSQAEANSFGNTGSSLSSSQSSSFAAGLTGISASNANSFNVNHPVFGGQSNANSNSFSVGQASASSQANAQNGQASSGSQASIGPVHSSASSGSNVHVLSDGLIIGQPQGPRKPVWTNIGPNHDFPGHPISNRPTLTIQEAPITIQQKRPITLTLGGSNPRWQQGKPQLQVNEWHPNGEVNFQGHQWRPHSKHEYAQGYPSTPNSQLQGQGQSNGGFHITVASADSSASSNSAVYTQGQATSVHRNPYGRAEGTFANVNSMRENGPSVDFVKFPGQTNVQSIPREFVRSKQTFDSKHQIEEKDFVESIVSDITDTVSDLLDIS
ncbi:hypothetical protein V1478_009537 [Vespula squamosa]|uniref:Uncharacterized protein n=1 Tax=Vespula squamosa TaxID=30214 RepID=A0ABD2APY2_VESSQ